MAKSQINMIRLMDVAWDDKYKYNDDTYKQYCRNLISHAYQKLNSKYDQYCKEQKIENDQMIFITFQRVYVAIMLCDGDFLQSEYDTYLLFCKNANFKPLSVEECKNLYGRMDAKEILNRAASIKKLRELVSPEDYESMVLGFCYLCLQGDRTMDENEFYILSMFFEPGYDLFPDSWDRFKKEWV